MRKVYPSIRTLRLRPLELEAYTRRKRTRPGGNPLATSLGLRAVMLTTSCESVKTSMWNSCVRPDPNPSRQSTWRLSCVWLVSVQFRGGSGGPATTQNKCNSVLKNSARIFPKVKISWLIWKSQHRSSVLNLPLPFELGLIEGFQWC